MFLILYCYVSCANVCVLHDSFMDFGNDIVVGNWPKSGKSLEKDEELIQQLVAKYSRSLGPTSPDTRVIHVRRAIMRDTHNNKDITERCMDMILKSVNWKKRH